MQIPMPWGCRLKVALFIASTIILVDPYAALCRDPISARTSEETLRALATRSVTPEFSERAFVKHEFGVAVAEVNVNASGVIKSVKVLQAPGPEIAEAMLLAIRKWKFKADKEPDGQPLAYSGKLTYYFLRQKGRPIVFSGTDSFYAGPQTHAAH